MVESNLLMAVVLAVLSVDLACGIMVLYAGRKDYGVENRSKEK